MRECQSGLIYLVLHHSREIKGGSLSIIYSYQNTVILKKFHANDILVLGD